MTAGKQIASASARHGEELHERRQGQAEEGEVEPDDDENVEDEDAVGCAGQRGEPGGAARFQRSRAVTISPALRPTQTSASQSGNSGPHHSAGYQRDAGEVP